MAKYKFSAGMTELMWYPQRSTDFWHSNVFNNVPMLSW